MIATKYFGEGVNPVGLALPIKIYDGNVELQMRIDGVIEDLPLNSDLLFKVLGSIETTNETYASLQDQWWISWQYAYVCIPDKSSRARIKVAVPLIMERELGEKMAEQSTFEF